MDKIHDTVAWYQKKIGLYDKQLWEQSVEQKVLKGIHHVPRKSVKERTEYIDVDLIRGSTFSKAKPQVPWTRSTRKAIFRVLFFPFYYKWWRQQASWPFCCFLLLLYILQVITCAIYFSNVGEYLTEDLLTLTEVTVPIVLMLILGAIHSQAVLSHVSHKPLIRDPKFNKDGTKSRKKHPSTQLEADQGSPEPVASKSGRKHGSKKSSRSTKANMRPKRNTTGVTSKPPVIYVTSKSDSEQKDDISSGAVAKPESGHKKLVRTLPEVYSKGALEFQNSNVFKNTVAERASVSDDEGTFEVLNFDGSHSKVENCHSTDTVILATPEKLSSSGDTEVLTLSERENSRSLLDSPLTVFTKDSLNSSFSREEDNYGDTELVSDDPSNVPSDVEISGRFSPIAKDIGSNNSGCEPSLVNNLLQLRNNNIESLPIHSSAGNISDDGSSNTQEIIESRDNVGAEESKLSNTVTGTDGLVKRYSGIHSILRRRRSNETAHEGSGYSRQRKVPASLGVRINNLQKESTTGVSSSEGETAPNTPDYSKATISSEEWEDRMQSDVASSSSYTSSCASDISDNNGSGSPSEGANVLMTASNIHVINLLQPTSATTSSSHTSVPPPDKVSCMIWEGNECKKVDLTALDIGWVIIDKVDSIPESSDYILIGIAFSVVMGLAPLIFRIYHTKELIDFTSYEGAYNASRVILTIPWRFNLIIGNAILQRLVLTLTFFFLLSVADRTFKQRLLYAKHFCYLTSSRRSRKYDMPHFRLSKVRNIKIWLSLRSYLKKRGPQRSVDVIVSAAFMLAIILVTLMCVQLLKDTEKFLDYLCNWELLAWCLALGVYILRFMTLGLKINKKYRNLSVLITEQINLYLQMEQKPHKKEDLMLANNVLKLAEDLLKELESPFKISGVPANPFVYNVTKVVVLSAFSAVLTELLGFKLKLYKINFKG